MVILFIMSLMKRKKREAKVFKEAVKLVADQIGNVEVVKLEVPTVFYKSIETVQAAIAKEQPDAVLLIG